MERAFGLSCGLHLRGVFFFTVICFGPFYGKFSTATTPLLIGLNKWHCGGGEERVKRKFCMHISMAFLWGVACIHYYI
jgi:hypothetical protein